MQNTVIPIQNTVIPLQNTVMVIQNPVIPMQKLSSLYKTVTIDNGSIMENLTKYPILRMTAP